jgi:CTP synthase
MKRIMEYGILPSVIACRAEQPVTDKVRQKISVYTNVPVRRVFSMHDLASVYLLPEAMREAGLDSEVVQLLNLGGRVNSMADARAAVQWDQFTSRILESTEAVTIGITGKYTALRDSYASIIHALEHAGAALGSKVNISWVDTTEITDANVAEALRGVHGVIVPGGFGVRGAEGKIASIRYVRTQGIPYLGLCYGFQLAVVEYARNVAHLEGANTTEIDPDCPHPVIDMLPEQKRIEGLGGNMRLGGYDVQVKPGTLACELFGGAEMIRLRFRHRYEVDPRYTEILEKAGMVFSGRSPRYPIMQILELPRDVHPYFVATQAHPEFTSRPLSPDPMFVGLVRAALDRAYPDGLPATVQQALAERKVATRALPSQNRPIRDRQPATTG